MASRVPFFKQDALQSAVINESPTLSGFPTPARFTAFAFLREVKSRVRIHTRRPRQYRVTFYPRGRADFFRPTKTPAARALNGRRYQSDATRGRGSDLHPHSCPEPCRNRQGPAVGGGGGLIAAATAARTPVRLATSTRTSEPNSRSGDVCQVTGSHFSGCLR